MEAEIGKGLALNSRAPDFDLLGTDSQKHKLNDFSKDVLVVIFTCNHCPYAKAYQDRIIELQNKFSEKVQIVGINSNDDQGYPDDSYENMVRLSKEKSYNFPYLRDDTQDVAKAYGGQVTPDCFVFDKDRKLRYRGRVDDNFEHPDQVKERDLETAIQEILDGKEVSKPESRAIGCSIKWKS